MINLKYISFLRAHLVEGNFTSRMYDMSLHVEESKNYYNHPKQEALNIAERLVHCCSVKTYGKTHQRKKVVLPFDQSLSLYDSPPSQACFSCRISNATTPEPKA